VTEPGSTSWIQRAADEVEKAAAERAVDGRIVCASGISPSGPIHLGNLREAMTVHLVTEELKARGRDAVHLHSWDDYDRFRKVPAGIDPSFAQHVGKPLSAVPDPCGDHESWSAHFRTEFTDALARLGMRMHEVRQSLQYPAGTYNPAIRHAMSERERIFDILAAFQTPGRNEQPIEARRKAYYPFKPYCTVCGTDETTVTSYEEPVFTYRCGHCGHEGDGNLGDGQHISGKLVWKVDWPMRWVHEGVVFEPAGEDHHSPTSSYNSGKRIAAEIFGGSAPYSFSYSFVGLSGGSSKMSGSAGGAAIPATALDILEPAIVRWLYARRLPSQKFSIDLTPRAVQRLYDEWDQFAAKAKSETAAPIDAHLYDVCVRTSAGPVATSQIPVSFRLLASVADITQANQVQMQRIIAQHLDPESDDQTASALDLSRLEPRLTCAVNYATRLVPEAERTHVKTDFDAEAWAGLDEQTRRGVRLLAEGLEEDWTLAGLTTLVYGVPKTLLGLPLDAAPTPELKKAQREFFIGLYRLICGTETGPRLPTLLLSIGPERARTLLTPVDL
jgi:lysyl-tRNA synthetase class 1